MTKVGIMCEHNEVGYKELVRKTVELEKKLLSAQVQNQVYWTRMEEIGLALNQVVTLVDKIRWITTKS